MRFVSRLVSCVTPLHVTLIAAVTLALPHLADMLCICLHAWAQKPLANLCNECISKRAFVQRLHTGLPPGIRLGYEGRFRKMLSYKMKNYALLTYEGTLHSKGSALVSRSTEPFGKRFMLAVIALLLQEDIQGLHDLYLATYTRIIQHDWQGEVLARTETLKASVEHYQADVASRSE